MLFMMWLYTDRQSSVKKNCKYCFSSPHNDSAKTFDMLHLCYFTLYYNVLICNHNGTINWIKGTILVPINV